MRKKTHDNRVAYPDRGVGNDPQNYYYLCVCVCVCGGGGGGGLSFTTKAQRFYSGQYDSNDLENKKKFPYFLQSAYVKKIEILTLKYCPRTNPSTSNHHQHTNFVKGTLCYLVSLKCAYTSSDSWICHCTQKINKLIVVRILCH